MNKKETKVEKVKSRQKTIVNQKNTGKHNKKILRVLVYITLVVFVLSLLFLLGYGVYSLCTSPKYNLANVTFEGNEKYTYEELREMIEVTEGTNLFIISKNKLENKLVELPYVDNVKILKKYPDTLLIKVSEYTPYFFAYNSETNRYVKLNQEGVILEECDSSAREENELIIFGVNFDDQLGERIVDVEITKLKSYLMIKEQYDLTNIDKQITSVEFKEGDIVLTLNHDINVVMDTNDLEYKLSFLKSILNEISGKAGTIDMTIENPIFSEIVK